MKRYLLVISALILSTIVFGQDWPDVESGGASITLIIQNLPATSINDPIAVFLNKNGTDYNLGQGVITNPSNLSFTVFIGNSNGVIGDLVTIQVYDPDTDSYSNVSVTPAIIDKFGFGFLSIEHDNNNVALVPSAALPVELTSFTGTFSNEAVTLNWATASEENNEFFTIEHSTNDVKFEALENIAGAGTTIDAQEYQYIDEKPESGVNYYRLKQTDLDGKFTYSEVITVKVDETPLTVNIFPNPVVSTANITLPASEGEVTIKVMDLSGREVISQNVSNYGQNIQLDVNELQVGMYMIVITNGEQIVTKQIQVNK